MPKVDTIVALLESRIVRGDYALRPIPAETRLAVETGVSRMTARKAVLRLVGRGLLFRGTNGRLHANPPPMLSKGSLRQSAARLPGRDADEETPAQPPRSFLVGFAAPAYGSSEIDRWRVAAERCVERFEGRMRLSHFHHWDDPILLEAINTFDGLFLVPPAEPMPPEVARKLRAGRARIVALDADFTPFGIRSVDLVPPVSVQRLLDHLADLGHRAIHCFNTQPMDSVIEQRIEQWSLWRAAQDVGGQLLNDPDHSYGDPTLRAYNAMAQRLAAGPLDATAVMCVTMPSALGAMRAMYERGIVVGREVSICAANDEGIAAYLVPSLTSTHMPDPQPYLTVCLKWMAGERVSGPLLSRPSEIPLFIGESTGPAMKQI